MNSTRHYHDFYKRRNGRDPFTPHHQRLNLDALHPCRCQESMFDADGFLLSATVSEDTGYRDLWTPGPWLLEPHFQRDDRVLWEIVGERAVSPWGGREQEANRHLIEHALPGYFAICATLEYLAQPVSERDAAQEAALVEYLMAQQRGAEGR